MAQLYVIKGTIGKIKISHAAFPLIEINTNLGVTSALVDASDLLGNEYKKAQVIVESYKLLD